MTNQVLSLNLHLSSDVPHHDVLKRCELTLRRNKKLTSSRSSEISERFIHFIQAGKISNLTARHFIHILYCFCTHLYFLLFIRSCLFPFWLHSYLFLSPYTTSLSVSLSILILSLPVLMTICHFLATRLLSLPFLGVH